MTKIRPEHPDDTDAVARLHIRAWQQAYAGILPDPLLAGLDPVPRAQGRRKALTSQPFTSLVIERDGVIQGFVTFGPYRIDQDETLDPCTGEILAIYVDPIFQGTGAGSALMQAALDNLPQAEVRLWVLAKNQQAQRFYRSFGLCPDGATSMFSPRDSDLEFPEIRMAIRRWRDDQQG